MKFFTQALLIASTALSVTAMFTPIVARGPHQHRALAARVAAASPTAPPPVTVTPRKRVVKRCKASSSSSSSSSSTTTSSSSSTSSSTPASTPTLAPINVGGPPPSSPATSTTPSVAAPPPPPATPTTTTHAPPPPSPTPTPTSSQAPPAPSSPSSGPDSGEGAVGVQHSGQGTWFDTGLGSCGDTDTDSDFIVAVSHDLYDSFPGYDGVNPNNNPVCGKKVHITYQGNSVDCTVVDRCTGCAMWDLDMTPTAFQQLAPLGAGRIQIEWDFTT